MFLAYSEIFGRAAGLKKTLQNWFIILARNEPSKLRLKALASLARLEKATIPQSLKQAKENRTGGTYLSVLSFFNKLENEGVLQRKQAGRRTYWEFTQEAKDMQKYFLLTSPENWIQPT